MLADILINVTVLRNADTFRLIIVKDRVFIGDIDEIGTKKPGRNRALQTKKRTY